MDDDQITKTHRADATENLSPVGKRLFRYIEFDKNEKIVAEIRKHPIGIVAISLVGIIVTLVFILSSSLFANNLESLGLDDGTGNLRATIIMVGLFLGLLSLVVTAISIVLYRLNVVFVTNEKIAEVAYYSIFSRKATQLGAGQIEDVTIAQRGIFARLFGYATLIIETAGEKENANFTLVPNPDINAQKIVRVHEEYVEKFGN